MFEVYVLVEQKKPIFLKVFSLFSILMGTILFLMAVLQNYLIIISLLAYGVGYFCHKRVVEFEYSFFDDEVRFAKILNKSRRKNLPGYKMSEVVMIAPTGDPTVAQYENGSGNNIRRMTSGKEDAKVYVMVAKNSDGVDLVYFEPNEKYLDAVCMKNGYKVRK